MSGKGKSCHQGATVHYEEGEPQVLGDAKAQPAWGSSPWLPRKVAPKPRLQSRDGQGNLHFLGFVLWEASTPQKLQALNGVPSGDHNCAVESDSNT